MIPIRDRLPTSRTPVVTWALIAMNLLAYAYEVWAQQTGYRAFVSDWGFVPGRFLANPANDLVTIATSMFLHGGLLHLGGNMLYLWIFGDNVEDRLGRLRFLGFYFAGGLIAAVAQLLVDPSSMVPMVGASGAVAAVLGGYVYLYPRAPITTVVPIFVFLQVVELPAFVVIGLWFVLQLVEGLLSLASPAHAGVAFFAHIGGFIAGLIAMMIVGRRPPPTRTAVDPWAGWSPPREAPRSWNLRGFRGRNRAAMPLALRLYNTLSRRVEPVVPREEGKVSVYCCGPTTYDISHAGHGRTFITPDLLVRHLRASGVTVRYVRNITDVDDKILKRARERGEEPTVLSERFAVMFQEDMQALSCRAPDVEPRVSQTIPRIVELVSRLIASESAYTAPGEGGGQDVWFAVRKFPTYGKLSGRSLDELRSGEGLEDRGKTTHEGKRDPLDFALWKSAPPGEWAFDSPWGRGRPGWHIECSAMVEEHLGFGIDIHAGGMDLIFPHHENEIAQSEAGCPGHGPFANVWVHGGFLNVDKEKMAKSLGNFVTMRDCFARNDPEALRTFLLGAHYRGPVEFETDKLADGRVVFPLIDEAESRVDYFYATVERLTALAGAPDAKDAPKDLVEIAKTIRGSRARVAAALDDDLNGPVAMAVVGEVAKAANDLCDLAQKRKKDAAFVAAAASLATEGKAAFLSCTDVLGIVQADPAEYAARTRARRLSVLGLDAAAIEEKVAARRAARDAKDFARGDAIRDELASLGVEIADSPSGTTWRVGIKRRLAAVPVEPGKNSHEGGKARRDGQMENQIEISPVLPAFSPSCSLPVGRGPNGIAVS